MVDCPRCDNQYSKDQKQTLIPPHDYGLVQLRRPSHLMSKCPKKLDVTSATRKEYGIYSEKRWCVWSHLCNFFELCSYRDGCEINQGGKMTIMFLITQ